MPKKQNSRHKQSQNKQNKISNHDNFTRNLILLVSIFALGGIGLKMFFNRAPALSDDACDSVSLVNLVKGVLPKQLGGDADQMGTVRKLWGCADSYGKDQPQYTFVAFMAVYILLQTFAIPGPIVLSILSGALYPFIFAQVIVGFCATTGATLCYLLSSVLGRSLASRLIPSMIKNFDKKVKSNKENLFYYMLFLRITPLLPNWFVNVSSPIVGIPIKTFILGTFFGLIPANFLHVSTGKALREAAGGATTASRAFIILFCLQFLALLPTLFKKKLQEMENKKFKKT